MFSSAQLSKEKDMKLGMWRVTGKVLNTAVELKLALTTQKGTLRAVSPQTASNKLGYIVPGKMDKQEIAVKLQFEFDKEYTIDELLSALPAGGSRFTK